MVGMIVANQIQAMFGEPKRWKTDDGILWAENDFLKMAYVVLDPKLDEIKSSGLAVRNGIFVKPITAEQAKLWDDCECRPN